MPKVSSRFPILIFSLHGCCFSITFGSLFFLSWAAFFYLRIIGRPLLRILPCIVCLRFSGTLLPSKTDSRGMHHNIPIPFSLPSFIFLPEIQSLTWLYISRSSAAFPCHSPSIQDTSVMQTVITLTITQFTQFFKY